MSVGAKAGIPSRDEIPCERTGPAGRKPRGEQAMTGAPRLGPPPSRGQAPRQARYRAARMRDDPPAAPPPPARLPSRRRRWQAAVAARLAVQAEYAAWLDAMPEALRDGPTGEALLAVVELDLSEIAAAQLQKYPGRD